MHMISPKLNKIKVTYNVITAPLIEQNNNIYNHT